MISWCGKLELCHTPENPSQAGWAQKWISHSNAKTLTQWLGQNAMQLFCQAYLIKFVSRSQKQPPAQTHSLIAM